jgi:hypothetical protein
MEEQEKLELGGRIWTLRKTGRDRLQVLQELGISVEQLQDCLSTFESRLSTDVAYTMQHCFHLDNERIEEVIGSWLPVALSALERPEEVLAESEADFDLRLKAGYAVLAAIDKRHKIMLTS